MSIEFSSYSISPSIGKTFEEQNPPLKRETFFDYFPNVCAKYPTYIRKETFKSKMERIIEESIRFVGNFTNKYWNDTPGSNQQGLIAMQRESARRSYIQDIKNCILAGIAAEEWRAMHEMNASKEMYNQSKAYFKTAGKEVAVASATAGAGKAFGKTLTKYSGQTVNKFLKPGTKLNQFVGKALGKEFKIEKWGLSAEFQGVNFLMEKSVEGYGELVDQALTKDEIKQYEGFDPDYFGDGVLGKITDFATDLIPHVSYAKTGVTSIINVALGWQTQKTADNMKINETGNNNAERIFNANLKQTIYDDVYFLSFDETESLICLCGLGQSIK